VATYIVRLIDSHEIVGIFTASTDMELGELVDECCETSETEYVEISNGGIFWPKEGAPKVPTETRAKSQTADNVSSNDDDEDDEFDPDVFLAGATITESWQEAIEPQNAFLNDLKIWMPVPGPYDSEDDFDG
jgi:hypothetical protein